METTSQKEARKEAQKEAKEAERLATKGEIEPLTVPKKTHTTPTQYHSLTSPTQCNTEQCST